jgi:14-3-3 protein epsilon
MADTDTNIFLARVAEQAERFEDMVDFLGKVLEGKGGDVSADERNLLSVAFKNLISGKRAACRTIAAIEQNPKYSKFAEALLTYKTGIESKLQDDCQRIIDMINNKVLSKPCDGEPKAFFIKMVGDYYRYIAEFTEGDTKSGAAESARKAYDDAMGEASKELPVTHPIRLGLALNFSVFHYEVLNNPDEACKMARTAFEDAIAELGVPMQRGVPGTERDTMVSISRSRRSPDS